MTIIIAIFVGCYVGGMICVLSSAVIAAGVEGYKRLRLRT